MQQTLKNMKDSRGITLIEVAITILIGGILLAGTIQFYQHFQQRRAELVTQHRMDVLEKAFSNYAQTRWRLPCPANPNPNVGASPPELLGEERRTGTGEEGCLAINASARGIVPFRTLGIPEQYAIDGFGQYFTYAVSPAFTRDNTVRSAGNNTQNVVHRRFASQINRENIGLLPKAQFCGAVPEIDGRSLSFSDDITMVENQFVGGGGRVFGDGGSGEPDNKRGDSDESYVGPDITLTVEGPPNANFWRDDDPENRTTGLAMALISHGPNKLGAYLVGRGNGTQGQYAVNEMISVQESQTATSGTGGTSAIILFSQTDRFLSEDTFPGIFRGNDDIIRYYTQDQIYAAAGGGSCEYL